MKQLFITGLLTVAAVVLGSAVAQAQTPTPSQSRSLVTQPASVQGLQVGAEQTVLRNQHPFTAEELNRTVGVLDANPQSPKPPQPTNSVETLIQKFSKPDKAPEPVDPIGFFRPPPLSDSVKVPLQ